MYLIIDEFTDWGCLIGMESEERLLRKQAFRDGSDVLGLQTHL